MWRLYVRQHPTFGPWFARVEGQPGWVVRTTLVIAGLVVAIPLVLAVMAAVIVGLTVFIVLSLVAKLTGLAGRLLGGGASRRWQPADPADGDQGRRNVRVIRDD